MMIMRWCRKATIFVFSQPRFLTPRISYTPLPTLPKSLHRPAFLSGHHYATESSSRLQVNRSSNHENIVTNYKKVDLQIISIQTVRPASPTPRHLRTFNFSIIDQFMYSFYTPLVLFLPNTDNVSVSDVITTRSKRLKESLSELLTRYYPFAGEIKDNSHIECNDKGVYFVEARVDQTLEEFLSQPDDKKVRELTPTHPSTTASSLGNYVTSVQVNIFNCGGIGLSTSLTHKIVDGHSYFTFMKAWAAAARCFPEAISPRFVASEVFPYDRSLEYLLPSKLTTTTVVGSTKRFVFDSTALASLKAQSVDSRGPTRTEATAALIWKAAAKAASTTRPFGPESVYGLMTLVNIRKRASPPFPDESIGNLLDVAVGICFPERQPDLPSLMGQIRESVGKIKSDRIEGFKGEKGHGAFKGLMRMLNDIAEATDAGDLVFVTSLLNGGTYEMDFGWGRPIWFYHMNPGLSRLVSLNDMVTGGGVEAAVTLSPEEMEIFERDPEVLSYATVNPSPLEFLH